MARAKQKVIRVGIIGQGRSGHDLHAACLAKRRNYKIVAVTDPIADLRAEAEREFGAVAYEDHRQMLQRDDLDLVVNTAPSHLHVPFCLDAFKTGHDVVCEKPLARRVAEVDKLMAAARKAKRMLAIFQQNRFAPHFVQVQKVIASGVLGRIVMVKIAANGFSRRWDWQTLQEYGGGSLLNAGSHLLDQVLQLFGPGMPKITCVMDRTNTFGDAEDHVKLIMHRKGQPTIDMEISSCCAYPLYSYQVYGTRGGLAGGRREVKWRYFDPKRAPKQTLTRKPLANRQWCRERLKWTERTWTVPKSKSNTFPYMSKQFYGHLYRTLTEGAPLVITPLHVRRQTAIIEECHRQNRLSKRRK